VNASTPSGLTCPSTMAEEAVSNGARCSGLHRLALTVQDRWTLHEGLGSWQSAGGRPYPEIRLSTPLPTPGAHKTVDLPHILRGICPGRGVSRGISPAAVRFLPFLMTVAFAGEAHVAAAGEEPAFLTRDEPGETL
jgi:hypothetical protein